MHPPGLSVPEESIRVVASNQKKPEGKVGPQEAITGTTLPESPSTESVVSTSSSISISGLGLRF